MLQFLKGFLKGAEKRNVVRMGRSAGGFSGLNHRELSYSETLNQLSRSPNLLNAAGELDRLRLVGRGLAGTSDIVTAYADAVIEGVLGSEGLQPDLPTDILSADQETRLLDDWHDWRSRSTFSTQGLDALSVETAILRDLITGGDAFCRFNRGEKGLSVDVMPSEFVPYTVSVGNAGRDVRLGCEVFKSSKGVTAFYVDKDYLRKADQQGVSDYGIGHGLSKTLVRVPAAQLVHIARIEHVDQVRGVPWIAPVVALLAKVEAYDRAMVDLMNISTRVGLGLKQIGIGSGDGIMQEIEDINPNLVSGYGAAGLAVLPKGMDFASTSVDQPSGNQLDARSGLLMRVAKGLGVSYKTLTGDLASANYSSMRAGLLEERDHWKRLQRWLVSVWFSRLWREWLTMGQLNGTLDGFSVDQIDTIRKRTKWRGRSWDWVDPSKDAKALIDLMDARVATPQEVIRMRGRDPRTVAVEWKQWQDMMGELTSSDTRTEVRNEDGD